MAKRLYARDIKAGMLLRVQSKLDPETVFYYLAVKRTSRANSTRMLVSLYKNEVEGDIDIDEYL